MFVQQSDVFYHFAPDELARADNVLYLEWFVACYLRVVELRLVEADNLPVELLQERYRFQQGV